MERLQPPILPEYLKGDDEDGPNGMNMNWLWVFCQCNLLKRESLVTGM